MDNYRYSPRVIDDYRITSLAEAGGCEVSSIMNQEEKFVLPLWNLFWLSMPTVDVLPEFGSTPQWNLHYQATEKALHCLILEVETDPVLALKLAMHPARFLEWFRREDHLIYDAAYHELGGEKWVSTVIRRASEAAERMAGELPPGMQGANIYKFIQRPRDDSLRDGTGPL